MITAWPSPGQQPREYAAAVGVELGEYVVEQQQRPRREQLRLREQQREHGQALLALGAELPQVARPARHLHVVEMRAGTGRSSLDIAF